MRRIQFIELHDQPWFPSSLRNKITDALQFGFNLLNVYAPIAPLLEGALNSAQGETVRLSVSRLPIGRLSICVRAVAGHGLTFAENCLEYDVGIRPPSGSG